MEAVALLAKFLRDHGWRARIAKESVVKVALSSPHALARKSRALIDLLGSRGLVLWTPQDQEARAVLWGVYDPTRDQTSLYIHIRDSAILEDANL